MGSTYFQKLGPIFFDMSSANEYMVAKYFQKISPRFWPSLTNGSVSEYIQFVITWDIQSIRGGDLLGPTGTREIGLDNFARSD